MKATVFTASWTADSVCLAVHRQNPADRETFYYHTAQWTITTGCVWSNFTKYLPLVHLRTKTQPKNWYLFYIPQRGEGWVNLAGWLQSEMVYLTTELAQTVVDPCTK